MIDIKPEKLDSPSLEQARKETDSSLETERTKTNETFIKEAKVTDQETDHALETSRIKADKDQKLDREAHDVAIKERRDSAGSISPTERRIEDQNLHLERKREDKARTDERDAADLAVLEQRQQLLLTVEAFLTVERQATDADMLAERTQTDEEIQRTTNSLVEVESAHEKTKESLSTRDEFLAIVSHDLKNPLTAISMVTALLLSKLKSTGTNSSDEIGYALMIQRSAAMMDRLITDLLDVFRMEAGKVQIVQSKQSIDELFHDCEELFGAIAEEKSIRLQTAIQNGPLFANVDGDRIKQVLSNLIGNALKHTPKGGLITLNARHSNGEIEIVVTDTGSGIPLKEQSRIFERFSQLGKQTRQGLGLGLYISKWIVESHGGKIFVRSSPGKGSSFTFSVPVFKT